MGDVLCCGLFVLSGFKRVLQSRLFGRRSYIAVGVDCFLKSSPTGILEQYWHGPECRTAMVRSHGFPFLGQDGLLYRRTVPWLNTAERSIRYCNERKKRVRRKTVLVSLAYCTVFWGTATYPSGEFWWNSRFSRTNL